MTAYNFLEKYHLNFDAWYITRIILLSLAIITFIWLCNKLIQKALKNFQYQHTIDPTLAKTLQKLTQIVLYSAAIILILDNLNLEISNVLRTLSVAMVALGF